MAIGDAALKKQYDDEAKQDKVDEYWRVHDWNVQVLAARAIKKDPARWASTKNKRKREGDTENEALPSKKSKVESGESLQPEESTSPPVLKKPYNPYEGQAHALQLKESVDDFLKRLRPSSCEIDESWIWCANSQARDRSADGDIATYKQIGTRLLDDYLAKRQKLESSFKPPKHHGVITRMMGAERKNLEEDILRAARRYRIFCGKWMLFPTKNKVDRYWAAVVQGTVESRLGIAAKVATRPDKPDEPTQVICVYTKDMTDEADIKRVLVELVRLKLASAIPGPLQKDAGVKGQIWYKPDCYTYLEILSGNEYKIKPTLYGTSSLLTASDVQGLG